MTKRRKKKFDPKAVVANSNRPTRNMGAELVHGWTLAKMQAALVKMFEPVALKVDQETKALRRMGRRARASGFRSHQGEREMARRRRQIDRGILTVSNGLQIA